MKKLLIIGLLGLIVGVLAETPLVTQAHESQVGSFELLKQANDAFKQLGKKTIPAVVYIEVKKTVALHRRSNPYHGSPQEQFGEEILRRIFGNPYHYRMPEEYQQTGLGSGFIISKDGYILTNNHVVGDADEITVKLHDGRVFEHVTLVGTDPLSEVAVIKIDADDLPFLPLGNSDQVEIGEYCIAVGNPFGLTSSLTVGHISAKGRSDVIQSNPFMVDPRQPKPYEDFIQTDTAINRGNSGGPLLNISGEAIGINTAIASPSGGSIGLNFAIPINMAKNIMDQLIEYGKVKRGFIGIGIDNVTLEIVKDLGLKEPKGIVIMGVGPDSAGEKAGLLEKDVILELNDKPVKSTSSFRNKIALTQPGTKVELTIVREGESRKVPVILDSLDRDLPRTRMDSAAPLQLGLSVQELESDLAQQLGYDGEEGVVVDEVIRRGPADRAGLEPGDLITGINRKPVRSVEEFNKRISRAEQGETLLFSVTDRDSSGFVTITP